MLFQATKSIEYKSECFHFYLNLILTNFSFGLHTLVVILKVLNAILNAYLNSHAM